jgi:hypothetical protein
MLATSATFACAQTYMTPIGFDRLTNSFLLPTGSSVRVTQIEALEELGFMADTNNAEFAGKSFRKASAGSTNISSHATTVGSLLYGNSSSLTPGIHLVTLYETDDWIGSGFLNNGLASAPDVETNHIQNHSWAGNNAASTGILRRLDFAITRDGFTAVVALGNNSNTPIDGVLSSAYNAICVGRSDGQHSSGTTQGEGPGRTKPDLVVPLEATSFATPVAGAAAALLLETALADPRMSDATQPACIKALLMAGATKDEFPDWDQLPGRPLDEHLGAGELNVFNSHRILIAGRQPCSSSNYVSSLGWDCATVTAGVDRTYGFTIPSNHVARWFSAILAWNRVVVDPPGGGFNPQVSLPNLSLRLAGAHDFAPTTTWAVSTSNVDNVEHVFVRGLGAGDYVLQVQSPSNSPYALAWFGSTMRKATITNVVWADGAMELTAAVDSNRFYAVEFRDSLITPAVWQTLHAEYTADSTLRFTATNITPSAGFFRVVPEP